MFPDIPLPTLDRAGITSLPEIDTEKARSIAQTWLTSFASGCSNADTQGILDLLHPSTPFWRDLLALTCTFRTFFSPPKIAALLDARVADTKLSDFTLNETYTNFQQPFPDLAWVALMFNFQTKIGRCTGVARLVPLLIRGDGAIKSLGDLEWKAHVVFTHLDSLVAFPEKTGLLRNFEPAHTKWAAEREAAAEFAGAEADEKKNPKVLLIGAGQSGLAVAARLKALDVPALIVDKNERIGDTWRDRYDSLSLHDPVWIDHMPYIPFPPTWPVYTPAQKLANWFEHYADALDLNVWTSCTITSLTQDAQTHKWHVIICRRLSNSAGHTEEQERKLVVNHVIFCTGFGSPIPPIPSYPGSDIFKGNILHSTGYKRATDYQGKKVVVVGACTSGHDIAMDCHNHGIDVTMYQRGSTYITSVRSIREVLLKELYSEESSPNEIADRLGASFPLISANEMYRRVTAIMAELDKDILDPLHKIGFRTNFGYDGTGLLPMGLHRFGGYYFDTGASRAIGEGKIKLKNDSEISHLTERNIVFDNGSELEADVVVFATGLGEARENVVSILSASNDPANAALIAKIKPILGLNSEGELNGLFSHNALGVPGLWYMLGSLGMCRFNSSHIALQIKAIEERIWGEVYEG